jgi:hypothetical protein
VQIQRLQNNGKNSKEFQDLILDVFILNKNIKKYLKTGILSLHKIYINIFIKKVYFKKNLKYYFYIYFSCIFKVGRDHLEQVALFLSAFLKHLL